MPILPSVFLDSHPGWVSSDLALLIAIGTAITLFAGLIFNGISLRMQADARKEETAARIEETNARILQTVREFFNDFIEIDKLEPDGKEKNDCLSYATGYLDILDAIAYLNNEKIIDNTLTKVFYGHFRYGEKLRIWYEDPSTDVNGRKFKEEFENCDIWLTEHKEDLFGKNQEISIEKVKEFLGKSFENCWDKGTEN